MWDKKLRLAEMLNTWPRMRAATERPIGIGNPRPHDSHTCRLESEGWSGRDEECGLQPRVQLQVIATRTVTRASVLYSRVDTLRRT